MLPLQEHGRCILSKNHSLQFLLIEFFLQGLPKQNNSLCDMACLCAGTGKVWDVPLFPVAVCGANDICLPVKACLAKPADGKLRPHCTLMLLPIILPGV